MEESRAFWSFVSDIDENSGSSSRSNRRRRSRRGGDAASSLVPEVVEDNYQPELRALHPAARQLLEDYTDIPEEDMIEHVLYWRDRAWSICPYGCIGLFGFTSPAIHTHPAYQDILRRINHGATLLDLGCGFGQDMRKLIVDGANPQRIVGADLAEGLIECGYGYFQDKETLPSLFLSGDILDPSSPLSQTAAGSFDIIWTSMFFHLWGWDQQLSASIQTAKLLKDMPGSAIIGWQIGATPAEEVRRNLGSERAHHETMFRHDGESFQELWQQVEQATGLEFDVRSVSRVPEWASSTRLPTTGSRVETIMFTITTV